MFLKMDDGRIVDAVKDCECCTHDGPHWLHMDKIWKSKNRVLLEQGTELATLGFIKEEQARLAQKLYEMKSRGVVEILKG